MQLHSKLPSNIYDFWVKRIFIDCTLNLQNEDIPCHRIILSKNSKFFSRLFCTSNQDINNYVIPFNPGNVFSQVILFFYSGNIDIQINNIAQYAAIAQYYEINSLFNQTDKYFTEFLEKENVYILIQNFCRLKVQRYHEQIIEFMIQSFQDYKIDRIISVTDSKLLSELLKKLQIYTIDEKIKLLDKFTKLNKLLTNTDKENLTSIYDFSKDSESYRFLIFNKCDWMVSSIQRVLLSTIIDKRKEKINIFKDETENSYKKASELETNSRSALCVGRWPVFLFISNISLIKDTKEVDLINFIRTLDGAIEPMNPIDLGLIAIKHSEPISPKFGGPYIFRSYHFASNKKDDEYPFIEFSLGWNNGFIIQSLQLFVPPNDKDKPKRPNVGPLKLLLSNEFDENVEYYVSDPNVLFTFSEKPISSSNIKMVMVDENSSGGWVFRFSYPKINGMFVLNFLKHDM